MDIEILVGYFGLCGRSKLAGAVIIILKKLSILKAVVECKIVIEINPTFRCSPYAPSSN
jgi:hypothetical protein